ncbi:MAG: AmmeMemoRadiSam system protein B [Verrucomicrobiae bacterium]|nr:AmmeMemoRadiSam system protein B [Verrucomicrobiae bacterium]
MPTSRRHVFSKVRRPAVAGQFYPADPAELRAMIERFLGDVARTPGPVPKALIAPHAGYIYSGPIAASAYARLAPARDVIRRIVLIGPSHHVPFRGLALSSAEAFETPLGLVPLDSEAVGAVRSMRQVVMLDEAHAYEHSLEVQLPFLQVVLSDFRLVPLAVGDATAAEVADVIERVWNGPETRIVISSDLSHYCDYKTAQRLDRAAADAIEQLRPEELDEEQACGAAPIRGMLYAAKRRGLRAQTVDLRNSGDTAGPRSRVVGYGAFVFVE